MRLSYCKYNSSSSNSLALVFSIIVYNGHMRKVTNYEVEFVDVEFSEIESVLKDYDNRGYYVVEMKPHYIANTPMGIYIHFAKKR